MDRMKLIIEVSK